jgi:prepilin-type N-terminal cleavage/methylation domain-containing protein
MKSFKKGFTLIELMVVIAIIGLLSSVVLANVILARAKAANARRLQDVRSYITAFEFFLNDKGYYPYPGNTTTSHCLGKNYPTNDCHTITFPVPFDNITNNLIAPYIPGLPSDPSAVAPSTLYGYEYFCALSNNTVTGCLKYDLYWPMSGQTSYCGLGTIAYADPSGTGISCVYDSPQIQ